MPKDPAFKVSRPIPRGPNTTATPLRSERDWKAPRAKIDREGRCRVCGCSDDLQAAHVIPRSQVKAGPAEAEENVIPLCGAFGNGCHPAYDAGTLDILPYLSRQEQASAVMLDPGGMAGAYKRLTGRAA